MARADKVRIVYGVITPQPYSGSLLRLALRTIAFIAVFAAAFVWWESSLAAGPRAESASRATPPVMTR